MINLKLLLLFIISFNSYAVLLDKVAGVINDKVITLSEINRVNNTLEFRKEVTPLIFTQEKYDTEDILKILQHNYIIKDKLSELGFVISDDSVESRITETEKRQGLRRQDLINFLDSKGITFSEYFELIRNGMEYSIFYSRIISPLVNITDQEVKNTYYNQTNNKKSLSFIYEITDFAFSRELSKRQQAEVTVYLDEYIKTGNIPSDYKDFDTNNLGKLKNDDLPKDLQGLLSKTNEGSFSKPYYKDGTTHIFYVSKKDLAESNEYLRQKEAIYNQLFIKKSKKIIQNWFSRESLNYYVLNNLWSMFHKDTRRV